MRLFRISYLLSVSLGLFLFSVTNEAVQTIPVY
jgi:hypothetical protein